MKSLWRVLSVFFVEVGFIAWKLAPHWRAVLEEDRKENAKTTPPMDNEAWGDRPRAARQQRGPEYYEGDDAWR